LAGSNDEKVMTAAKPSEKKYVIWLWVLYILGFLSVVLIFVLISLGKMGPMPTFEQLENPRRNLASEVYSEDGKLLGKFYISEV